MLPLYGIPENTLPPAPWDERPAHLTWKLYVSVGAFAIAVPFALIAVAAAWLRLRRTTLVALTLAGGSLVVSAVVGAVGAVQWAQAVPGSGTTLVLSSGHDCVPGLCRGRVASIGGACQSPHLRPISPT